MIVSLSWKNVWRNKLRSSVVISAVAVGVMGGTFMIGLMIGWIADRSHSAIYIESSHIQIHHPKFRANEEAKYSLSSADKICNEINNLPEVASCTKRIQLLAMATAGYKPSGFFLRGIDPEQEKKVSELYTYLSDTTSHFFEKETRRPILLSEKSAKELRLQYYIVDSSSIAYYHKLEIPAPIIDSLQSIAGERYRNKSIFYKRLKKMMQKSDFREYKDKIEKYSAKFRIGKKIEITIRAKNGNEVSNVFRLIGVFKTNNTGFDSKYAYVHYNDLRKMAQMDEGEAHEIAIIAADEEAVEELVLQLQEKYPYTEVLSWRTILPDIAMYADMMAFYASIFMIIILFALGFGIVNTMLMVVLERTKELGMLMAIGMNRKRVFWMIILETIILSSVGGLVGMLIGLMAIEHFSVAGIDLSAYAEGMEAMGYSSVIYPDITSYYLVMITLMIVATGIIAAIYPARKAITLSPAEAIRTE